MSHLKLGKKATCAVVLASFSSLVLVSKERMPFQAARNEKAIYVGVIEDSRRELAKLGPKDFGLVKTRTITPAFMKDASGWKAMDRLNQRITWTVAFDGKILGEVQSEPFPDSDTSEKTPGPTNAHRILTNPNRIPAVGKPEGRFNGNFETDVRRPLIVVSEPHFADPDGWKREPLPEQVEQLVRTSFREVFKHVRQCDPSGEPSKTDWNVPDSEIAISKAYGSNNGWFVVETELKHNPCMFNLDFSGLQSLAGNHWFYVTPARQVEPLGNRWELVDAGDYDADGKSEVIFYVAEGREGSVQTEGYVLFFDDFHHQVRFTWSD